MWRSLRGSRQVPRDFAEQRRGDGGDGDEPPFGGLLGSCRGQFLSRLGPALGPCWKLCRSIVNGVR
eukprot:381838-Pyramimonas_sp.AAC.1